jgi:hypothetical protein
MAVLMLCAIKSHSSSRREWPNRACNRTRRWLTFCLARVIEITSRSAHLRVQHAVQVPSLVVETINNICHFVDCYSHRVLAYKP